MRRGNVCSALILGLCAFLGASMQVLAPASPAPLGGTPTGPPGDRLARGAVYDGPGARPEREPGLAPQRDIWLPIVLRPSASPTATATHTPHLSPSQTPTSTGTGQPTGRRTPTATLSATDTPTPTATPEPAPCSCDGNLYNCTDFATRAEAQRCYDYCMGQVGYDIHGLDSDKDGEACESLP